MANLSYLVATTTPVAFPTLRKEKATKHEIIACGEWRVPLLWYALFRPEDMVEWRWPGKDGPPFALKAPIVARSNGASRLSEAASPLHRTVPQVKTWDVHLHLLGKAIDSLDKKFKYITCDWPEIVALDPPAFYSFTDWLLKFFAGGRVQQPKERLTAFSGLKFSRSFRNPEQDPRDKFRKQDWDALAVLLGVEYEREAPWTPRGSSAKPGDPVHLLDLIDAHDVKGVERALAVGTPIPSGSVAKAAWKDARILKLLLAAGGDPNDVSVLGAALANAFDNEDVAEKVNALLAAGADVNYMGEEHDFPYILGACLSHGMEFSKQILSRANEKTLREFVKCAVKPIFRHNTAAEGVTWIDEFIALARKQLARPRKSSKR